jgi:sensor histidine kinase YesM
MKRKESLIFIFSMLILSLAYSQQKQEADMLFQKAEEYSKNGESDSSIANYQQAFQAYNNLKDSLKMGECINSIAILYRNKGNYSISLQYFLQSLTLYDKIDNTEGKAKAYNGIGILYMSWKDYSNALKYYKKALFISDLTKNEEKKADVLNNIGLVYKYTAKYDSALYCFQKSLKIRLQYDDACKIASSYHNLGIVYNAQQHFDKAIEYYMLAYDIRKKENDVIGQTVSMNALGNAYMNIQQYTVAEEYFNEALLVAKEFQLSEMIITLYENMTINYSLMEKHDAFRHFFDLYIGYYDSIFNVEKHKQLMEIQMLYETEKKEKKILLLNQEIAVNTIKAKNRQIVFVIASAFIILLSLFAIFLYRYRLMQYRQKEQQLQEKLLRLQMNPHFIFNALEAIQSYILEAKPKEAASFLAKFSKLMRSILEQSFFEQISLEEEIEILEYYIDLQKIRHKNKFEYYLDIDQELEIDAVQIPPLLLQPFVENAIEHAFRGMNKNAVLHISVYQKKNFYYICIDDNGCGIKSSKKEAKRKSLSTTITKERIEIFKKKYHKQIGFSIMDKENGTQILFTIAKE